MDTKERIEALVPFACQAIRDNAAIYDKNSCTISKSCRSKMSSFGASIIMGSLKATICNYSYEDSADAGINKPLMDCLWSILKNKDFFGEDYAESRKKSLYEYIKDCRDTETAQEQILEAATALKMAMNLFSYKDKKRGVSG